MPLDLARAKSEPRYLIAALGVELTDWQAEALDVTKPFTTILGGRQMGKSLVLAALALWRALTRREAFVLIVSSTEDNARDLLGKVRQIVSGSPLLDLVDELAGRIKLTNGSEIRCVSASERQIRGSSVDLLLLDEAQLLPEDLIVSAALPTVSARQDARVVMAGSASQAFGTFYDFCERGSQGDRDIHSLRWVSKLASGNPHDLDAPWLTPTIIEAARSQMRPSRFAAEYLATFASSGEMWISHTQLERVIVDRPLWSLASLAGPARISLGIDWGRRIDRSAAVGIGRVPGESMFAVVCAHRAPADTPGIDFITDVVESPAHYGYVMAERNGMGQGYCEQLWTALRKRDPESGGGRPTSQSILMDVEKYERMRDEQLRRKRERVSAWHHQRPPEPFVTQKGEIHVSSQSKAATYGALHILIDRGQLLIPRDADQLIRELLLLQVDITATGQDRIEASSGHDDLPDALSLATVPHSEDGRWRTLLTDLAERSIPRPLSYNDSDPGAFQSLLGREVTSFRRKRNAA